MKKEIWVIIANGSKARIFKVEKNALENEMASLVHAASRLRDVDLVSANLGRTNSSVGNMRSAMEPATDPKEHEMALFAKEIADRIDGARSNSTLERFYVAASPTFLGLLRSALSAETLRLLKAEVPKDLIQLTPKEIREYFPPVL